MLIRTKLEKTICTMDSTWAGLSLITRACENFGLGTRLDGAMNSFIDQGEFEATKMLSGWEAPH